MIIDPTTGTKTRKRPSRALVLPGGGARGAYQVGVLKALHEKGIEFDYVFGTSVGALNACFLAQGTLNRLEELWHFIKARSIYKLPSAPHLGRMFLGSRLGLLDANPLEDILRRELSLSALKESKMKLGIVSTDLCSLETRLFTMDDIMSTDELIDVLMATSALPIAFPPRAIHKEGLWVDGGLVRNTPLQAAIDIGAEEIYMVLLHPEKIVACPVNMVEMLTRLLDTVLYASAAAELKAADLHNRLLDLEATSNQKRRLLNIRIIQPHKPLSNNLLEIHPEHSSRLIQAGYEDALEHLVTYFQGAGDRRRSKRNSSSTY